MDDRTIGNEFELLENGKAFFPRLSSAVRRAETEALLQMFMSLEGEVGIGFAKALSVEGWQ